MTSYARNNLNVNFVSGAHNNFRNTHGQHMPSQPRREFLADLSQCLLDFVMQLLPTAEEMAVKEDVRKLLERLIRTIEPDSRLLSFGSTANGFSLRNSDMDLCCLIDSEERLSACDLVTMVGDLLERETKFHVKPLPHARIPIVKLSLDPSPGLPLGIASDIGFENRLALENTRLLLCYSMVDPTRVRTLVLFLKVWSKRRKINSPYKGTLSSYGYVLLVIYFLVHVKNPPVLPNLQQIPPPRPIPADEYHIGDRNVWFFDDIETLRLRWQSPNTESVAELLIDFFRYYARDFSYNTGVASIKAGLLRKDSKGWQNDNDPRFKDARERNRLCIEDPFETDYNVARCVTKDGLYMIRGEFMRACRILASRPERAYMALGQLCEERDENLVKITSPNTVYIPPRLSLPPQTPYTVGSNSFRPHGAHERDRLSPPRKPLDQDTQPPVPPQGPPRSPPEHMAPKRTLWTSPPPPEAPDSDRTSYEDRLGFGLSLATAATDAREQEKAYLSSSSNSEILSDDGDAISDMAGDDDVKSVRSFTGETSVGLSPDGPSFLPSSVPYRLSEMFGNVTPMFMAYQHSKARALDDSTPTPYGPSARGRRTARPSIETGLAVPPTSFSRQALDLRHLHLPGRPEIARRSNSGPPRDPTRMFTSPLAQGGSNVVSPPSPVRSVLSASPTIYYETTPQSAHSRGNSSSYSSPQSPVNPLAFYQQHLYVTRGSGQALGPADSQLSDRQTSKLPAYAVSTMQSALPGARRMHAHAHTYSNTTITAPTTPAASSFTFTPPPSGSQHSSPTHSPIHTTQPQPQHLSLPPHSGRRESFNIAASPIATASIGTPSPPSSVSSRSGSAGSVSPVSSTSPRTADLSSPLSLSPPGATKPGERLEPGAPRQRVESAKFLGIPPPTSPRDVVKMKDTVSPASPLTPISPVVLSNTDEKTVIHELEQVSLTETS